MRRPTTRPQATSADGTGRGRRGLVEPTHRLEYQKLRRHIDVPPRGDAIVVDAEESLPPTHEREERLGPLLGAEGGEDEVPFFEREPCGGRGRSLR